MTTKDVLFSTVQKALALCQPEDSPYSAVMVVVNNDDGGVQVYGLNIDEIEVPVLLAEAAAEIGERVSEDYDNRTLN